MSLEKLTDSKIERIAEVQYPVTIHRDIDGDKYDSNKNSREAFIVGMTMAVAIHNGTLG